MMVFVETGTWLAWFVGSHADGLDLTEFARHVTPDQLHRAWIFFQRRGSAGWSFTDCTSKIIIDELEIKTAVALDDHFRQFGITVVP